MLESRVIPCLQLLDTNLVKTVKFGKYSYIGDPLNTCRIFNELEVDEMIILGIRQTAFRRNPDFEFLRRIASECFMPLAYGGGITSTEDARKIFGCGYEKIIINSAAYKDITLITEIANIFGNQSVIASVDVKKGLTGRYIPYSQSGNHKERVELHEWVKKLADSGAGEMMITNIDKEGTWTGFDLDLLKDISSSINIPVIAHGGAGGKQDVEDAVNIGGASAVALGSMVVYQKKGMGVLVNYSHDYSFKNTR